MPRHWLTFFATTSLGGVPAGSALAQTPADGPWSGQAQCVLVTDGPDYHDEQTHTWTITAATPEIEGAFRRFPATWSVAGTGRRGQGDQATSWTTTVAARAAPISVYEPPGTGNVKLMSRHGLLVESRALSAAPSSAGVAARVPLSGDVQEWAFPVIEAPAAQTSIQGSSERTVPGGRGFRAPPRLSVQERCSWSFTRAMAGATSSLVRPGAAGAALDPARRTAPAITRAGAGSAAPGASTPPAGGSSTPPPTPTADVFALARISTAFPTTPGTSNAGVLAGGTVVVGVTVTNAGPSAADGTTFTVPAAAGLAQRSVSCPLAACPTAAQLEAGWPIPQLASGAELPFYFEYEVTAASGTVDIAPTLALPAGITDPTPGRNGAGFARSNNGTPVIPAVIDLEVALSPGTVRTQRDGSQDQTFEVRVSNAGPRAAAGALLVVPPVPGLVLTEARCLLSLGCPPLFGAAELAAGATIPQLDPGRDTRYAFTMAAVASGSATVTVTVSPPSGLTDSVPSNDSASQSITLTGAPRAPAVFDLGVTLSPVDVRPDTVAWRVRVDNGNQNEAVYGPVVRVPAVAGLVKVAVACAGCAVQPSIADIEAGFAITRIERARSELFTITTMATTTGTVTMTAAVAAPSTVVDDEPANDNASVPVSVAGSAPPTGPTEANLAVSFPGLRSTVGPQPVSGAAELEYGVLVRNAGPGAAHGAVVAVPAIAGVTVQSVVCRMGQATQRPAYCPSRVTPADLAAGVPIPWLPSGSELNFTVRALISPLVSDVALAATVQPVAPVTDFTPANNTATGAVHVQR